MLADKNDRGFTLIELAVVIAIVALIMASALGTYKVQVAKKHHETTQDRILQIRVALTKYRVQNSRLPCPARLDAPPNTPSFGIEDVTGDENCSTAAPSAGTFRTSSTRNLPADPMNTVRIGAVPVKELGLPQEFAFDSWGRRFTYAVSERLANHDTPYLPAYGTITVLGADGAPVTPKNRVPFVVISHGKNGRGGTTYDGKTFPTPCPSLINSPERDNCNITGQHNTTFRDAAFAETGNDATHFDDYISYTFVNLTRTGAQNPPPATENISASDTTNADVLRLLTSQQDRIDTLEKTIMDLRAEIRTIKTKK